MSLRTRQSLSKKRIVRKTSAELASHPDARNKRKVKGPIRRPATRKQALLLGFIRDYIELHTYSPSYKEIQTYLKATSLNAVVCALDALSRKGLIELPKRHRAFRAIIVKERVET